MTKSNLNLLRTAGLMLCVASLALPAMAQTDSAPPPPPDSQQQGPPPQGGPGGRGMRGERGGVEERLHRMQDQLNLTPDQHDKIKSILESGRSQMMALRDDTSGGDRREKMQTIMKSENEQIRSVLDKDQREKFKAMEERQREQMRARRDGNGPGGPGGDNPPPPPPPQPPSSPQL